MVGLEVEVVRATLVIGIVLSGLVFHFTRLSSGGVVTTPFLAMLVLTGRWHDIAGWAVIALIGVAAIRLVAARWPLPRPWLFYCGVFTTTAIHVIGIEASGSDTAWSFMGEFSLFLAAGLYVCSGLTAYDAARQGIFRTFAAAAVVTAVTVAVMQGVRFLTVNFGGPQAMVMQSPLNDPVLAVICVGMAAAMRVGPRWGTAGIIGSLYLLNIASWQSLLVMVVFTLAGAGIYRAIADSLGLSPKERFYALLAVGSIASWFGLFWAQYLGIPGAAEVAAYAVEPLIVIGLMIGETARYGIARTAAGSVVVYAVTAGAAAVIAQRPGATGYVVAAAMAIVAGIIGVSLIRIRREWAIALAAGDKWGVTPGNLSDVVTPETRIRGSAGPRTLG